MKYLVMECHKSFAVLLSEDGKFIKAANKNYTVGQYVSDIVEMKEKKYIKSSSVYAFLGTAAALAACFILIFTSLTSLPQTPYASVYMSINPSVQIDINKENTVMSVKALNTDAETLTEDYSHKDKSLDTVIDELVQRAIDMGFLSKGGRIDLTFEGDDNKWIIENEKHTKRHLSDYLSDKISVSINVGHINKENSSAQGESNYSESDYGESDYDESDYDESDYGESDYETENNYGGTGSDEDYSDSDYQEEDTSDDSNSDYDEEEASDDSNSDYDEEEASDDSNSDYENEDASDYESDD